MYTRNTLATSIALLLSAPLTLAWALDTAGGISYPVVDTAQDACFDDSTQISCPQPGEAWFGQDAQYSGNPPAYTPSADGLSVQDEVTGLTWQRSADRDGDGVVDADDKVTGSELAAYVAQINSEGYGGYSDWRLPTIKELYSLTDFRGTDPMVQGNDSSGLVPFIDTDYFDFAYGDTSAGERLIDSQWATSTRYVADETQMFGVNFADGRIKGYWTSSPDPQGGEKGFYVRLVRGSADYGLNDFVDNGDGSISDQATGLTWMRQDSLEGMPWQEALAFCSQAQVGGHDDWRLPNAKELQSLVDYGRSPDTSDSAAIDPLFDSTPIINEDGVLDYPYYWSSTTHLRYGGSGEMAAYLAFGRGLGEMNGGIVDVHGAGCQRSDPKYGSQDEYPQSFGPQGDIRRVFNYVRCVRGGVAGDLFTGGEGQTDPGNGDTGDGGGDPGPVGGGNSGPGELPSSCDDLSAGDACTLVGPFGAQTGVCRNGPVGLRCAPEGSATGAPAPRFPGRPEPR